MQDLVEIAKQSEKRLKFKFPYEIETWVNDMGMMMENQHKHTTWSNLTQIDSATSINDFMKMSSDYGCQCYFSGEHGYPGEWLFCYDSCKQTNDKKFREKIGIANPLKFRYSAEVYWVKDRNAINEEEFEVKKGKDKGQIKTRRVKDSKNCHMVLIARTYKGIRMLNYIISIAQEDGFYYKPRIDLELLFMLDPEDVYVCSACIAGWKYDDSTEIWYQIWQHFGDSLLLEYQTHHTKEQRDLNNRIYNMSQELGIQTIIGLDTHYLNDEDRIKRDNLLLRKGIIYDDEVGWHMDFPNGLEVFRRMVEQEVLPIDEIIYSMMNTHIFVDGCEDLEYSTDFKIPILPEYENNTYEERSEILYDFLTKKFNEEPQEYQTDNRKEGMEYEFSQIKDSGTVDYFLSNTKLIDSAINDFGGCLTTTSRGSASSYYCSKLLGFTTIDRFDVEVPIFPERFITKDRILASHSMPDIDMNIVEQAPFVKAAKNLFGEHSCYPLLAVGKLGEKSGFKVYAGVKGLEPSIANEITSLIDKYNEAIKQADDETKDDIKIEDYITNEKYLKLFNESKPYQNIIEQARCHACGFLLFNGDHKDKNIVGYGDIRYEIGLIRCVSKNGNTTIVANVEGSLLDLYGFCKDDFLIVDVVGIIQKLYSSIGMKVPTVQELRKMVDGDTKTWDLYANGITCCLNQCEKQGTRQRAMKYKPQNIKELSAFIAAIRPGFKSLLDGFLNRVEYSTGEEAIDKLLKDSFHYLLYQEGVMQVFSYLGIPMKDSYDTIKKISKKKLVGEALKKTENTLKEHWFNNIGNLNNFESVYQIVKDSARYSFNSPHSYSMANDSLYEAWMKAHNTSKFYEVTLNHYSDKGDKKKVADLEKEAFEYFGYTIGSYQFGKDNSRFTVDDDKKIIYPSLSSVKGFGEKTIEDLYKLSQKQHNDFIDIYLSIEGTRVNKSVMRDLIKINYFKDYGNLNYLLKVADLVDEWKGNSKYGKKTIKKEYAIEQGLSHEFLLKYATDEIKNGTSEKQYKITNWIGLVKDLASKIEYKDATILDVIKYQHEILGYIEYRNYNLSKRFIAITSLNTEYSPRFKAVCLNDGQISEMRIAKRKNKKDGIETTWNDCSFEDGDIIYMDRCIKKPRMKKDGDSFVVVPGEFNWILAKYHKVKDESELM